MHYRKSFNHLHDALPENMNRPRTTLFMLMSVDGKISTGDTDELDFDRDLKRVSGVREGLQQYYDLERKTDFFSLNTGRVMEKIGINKRKGKPKKSVVSFIIIDNKPHLTAQGVSYLSAWIKHLFIVTTNKKHPAVHIKKKNITVVPFARKIDFKRLFVRLKTEYGVRQLTIQSGGTLNAVLIRSVFIDHLSVVVAPVIVGGATTPTIVDGESRHTIS